MADEARDRAIERLTEIQRRGLDAAGALVERLIASVDGLTTGADGSGPPDEEAPRSPWGPAGMDELVDGWAKLWRDSVTGLASAMPAPGGPTARVDVRAPAAPTTLVATLDADGRAGVEVWVHNTSTEPYQELRVRCGPPVSHAGTPLPLSVVSDPDVFDLPPRSSRGVLVALEAVGAEPGTYRGIVVVEGLPDQWLALEVEVPEVAG